LIIGIDGKPQGRKAKMPDLPVRGEFATSVLFGRFISPDPPPSRTYRLAGIEEVSGVFAGVLAPTRALRIEFATPQRGGGSRTISTVAGSMLIDAETMR
jgi:hypothetical protein